MILSLAAECVDAETKEAMGRRLHSIQNEWNPGNLPLSKATVPEDFISADGSVPEEWIEVNTHQIISGIMIE